MSFGTMINELHGCVPKIPFPYCKTLINRAWADVRRRNLWSFLIFEGSWSVPPVVNAGTAAVTQGSTTVTLDANATAALQAAPTTATQIIQRQFRVGISGIYNIWEWDGASVLTLDRPYAEVSSASVVYMIFQCYYAAPMQDFLGWISVRDLVNFLDLFTDRYNRAQLDEIDPQRTWYYFPTDVVFYMTDKNVNGITPGFPLFELWGAPLFTYSYNLMGMRRGVDLVLPTDTLPLEVGEDCVMAQARVYAYEWAEANKGDSPRNQGPDFRFLMGSARAEYEDLYRKYRKDDREMVDNYFSTRRSSLYGKFFGLYNTLAGTAYPGPPL